MWNKFLKGTICVLAVVLLCSCLAVGWLYFREQAENSMDPDGKITILERQDGSLILHWPEGKNVQNYHLEILQGEKLLHSAETAECDYILPELPEVELTVRITSSRDYLWTVRSGTEGLEAAVSLMPPRVADVKWDVDWETGLVTISYTKEEGSICTISRADTGEILVETEDSQVQLLLGKEPAELELRVTRAVDNVTFYGYVCAAVQLETEDYLSEKLELQWEGAGENQYHLTWNETKGDGYLVEISKDGENWQMLEKIPADAERKYTTEHLAAFDTFFVRVSACDGAISDMVTLTTAQRTLYSTIWPVQDLGVYADPDGTEAVGTASAGKAYCVLAEFDGMFAVRFGETIGYIDSNYCMINAVEYLGKLCSYDIPNSYDSLYRVHGVEIPKVTDMVIVGYENVMQVDGTYLVPVLYPAAQKLLKAAIAAREMGYRLKIYDSYRPYRATKEIYALTENILDTLIPDGSQTVQAFMTDNGRYRLGNFLAPVTSRHNYGVALDLTLETLDGEELQMQTALHDLSWYSALENNGENADMLQELMVAAGFATLASEWWHFQDAEAFDMLKPSYLTEGVTAECWVMDDTGWRYRLADGAFLTACEQVIDGQSYEFDADGYVA